MKLKYSSIILSLSALIMIGCTAPNLINSNETSNGICLSEPEWVLKPPMKKGKIYGIGIAPPNFNGEAAQRKSAISKAVSEIASQLNTTVNSQTITSSVLYNKSANHSMSSISFQTVNGQKVSSKIIKSCKNPNNNYLYILMEADKGFK
jgi:uncharacterized protein YcfL